MTFLSEKERSPAMRTSITSQSLSGDLAEKLDAAAAAGFAGIELSEQDLRSFGGPLSELGRIARDQGLDVTSTGVDVSYEGMPDILRQRALDVIERRLDQVAELGCDLVKLGACTDPAALGGVDRMAADLNILGERAASRGLRIGYQTIAWGRHVADLRDAWEVVRRTPHPAIGLVLDSFHTLVRGGSPEVIRAIPGDRIFHVQISDSPAIGLDLPYLARHFRCLPGEGDLPLTAFLRAVAASGYEGWLGSDTSVNRSRSGPRSTARDAQRALRLLADRARQAEPSGWLRSVSLPPPAVIEGVAFVEFAADQAEALKLGKLLAQMGFAHVGQHVSKDVSLWQQSDISIVVNSEGKGYAHSARVMHGTSVCDIGLLVEDAAATAARARAFGANDFTQVRGSDELPIPAVRGVGGSVLHFLDRSPELSRVWDHEFRPVPAQTGQTEPVGLERVDHIAQVMSREELLSWTLLYGAIFDIVRAPEVSVADPGGMVASRAMQNSDGTVRFTLNGVDTHHTFAGRFMADSYGSSVQHLAFQTRDIFQTAERLAACGLKSLPVSADYYAELGALFGLSGDFLDELAKHNLFYDEDGRGGGYFQMYSLPFGDGFFFEFVERRGGYDGYGAPNAAYRTAALKRSKT